MWTVLPIFFTERQKNQDIQENKTTKEFLKVRVRKVFIMTTDVVSVASLLTMCVLGYCVMKLCLALINAIERTVQAPELGAGEQIVVRRAVDTRRGLRRNSIEIPPALVHRNAYNERRVSNSFKEETVSQSYLKFYLSPNQSTWRNG